MQKFILPLDTLLYACYNLRKSYTIYFSKFLLFLTTKSKRYINTVHMIIVFSKCITYNKLKAFKDIMLFRKKGVYLGAKDITEKILADYNDVFADIANVLLFQGEQMVSPDSLKNERTLSQYKSGNDRLHEQERDILKSWTDGNIKIALIGFENQTNPDKYMPVRIFSYEW